MADPNPFDQFDATTKAPAAPSADVAAPQSVTLGTPHIKAPEGYQPSSAGLSPIPGGPADPNRPGGPLDPNDPKNAKLTPEAVDDATAKLILTGQMDPMGMGGGPVRLQILNNRAKMLQKYGITDQQLPGIQAQFQSDSKAFGQRVQQLSFIQQATEAANQHIHQITGYLKDLPAQTDWRGINAASNYLQRQHSGETITNLDATIPLLESEFARIMTGNPTSGAGQITDQARQEFDILRSNVAPERKIEALNALSQMGQAKIDAVRQEIDGLHGRMSGGLQTYAQLLNQQHAAVPPAPGGPTGPGAGPGDGNGGGGPSTDPNVQDVGGFHDQLTQNPDGAVAFHDALFNAAHAKQISSVAEAQNWAAAYNKQHGTDFGVADTPSTRKALTAAVAGQSFGVDIPQMTQGEAARMNDRIRVTQRDNPKADAAIAGGLDSASVGAFRPAAAFADAAGDALTGKPFDYAGNLNADTGYLQSVHDAHPGYYLGGQLAGGVVLPSFGARSIPELSRLGAGYGAAYGFNSSAGQPLADRAVNALTDSVTGAAIPIVLGTGAKAVGAAKNALGSIRDVLPQRAQSFAGEIDPTAIAQAGQAEGVTVNRAMVDPSSANRVSAVDRSMVGGPILQRGMREVGGQIEQGVQKLGNGGTAMEPQTAGGTVAGAGLRYITQTGAQFNRLYGSLQKATAGLKIPATQTVAQIDSLIGDLSELPNENASEISWLNGLKQDLQKPPRDTGILDASGKVITTSRDVGLSIDAMRSLRTKIRQELAKGNLTFGPEEGRVASLGDTASQDIANGLTAAGKGDIAQRFQQVDQAYRDRMGMIQGTIQKLVGKRGQSLSGEQVYANLKSMAGPRGSASGLNRMFEQMTPDERSDIQATLADALGRDAKGNFSTAILANQAQKMPQAMKVAAFGQDGAQSLNNLATLARAHARVSSKMSGSPTGVANDYRSWLNTLMFGGGDLLLTHSGGNALIAAGGAAAVKGTRDVMNARLLLNKDVQRWIQSAPATASQRAIDVHFNRLNAIAAKNPGIAADIEGLKHAIMSAANDNVSARAAASGGNQGDQNNQQ